MSAPEPTPVAAAHPSTTADQTTGAEPTPPGSTTAIDPTLLSGPLATVTPPPRTGPNTRLQPIADRVFGDSGITTPPLALGGKAFGWLVGDRAARRVLDAYADGGGRIIDTADSYAGGRSETIIGSWMASGGRRDRVLISTKVGKSPDHPGLSPRAVAAAVDASLQRLRTDRIDLLFLHVDDPKVPFEETLMAVDRLIRAGKVRSFGAADHHADRIVEARIACGLLGVAPMSALQNEYNLLRREGYERDLMAVAAAQHLGVMPRFSLASGFLTGSYRSRLELRGSSRGRDVAPSFSRRGFRILSVLEQVAEEQDVSMAAIAVAWLLTRPNVVAPIVSATEPDHVADLLVAPMLSLTREQVRSLDDVSAWR